MSYQAIARKWRPTTFDEIVGQGHVTQTLQNAIRLDRVHHGFLFTGARGVGKTTAARVLARALNCEQGPTPDPCGSCGNCVELLAGSSPDVVEIDGASNNSVEDVRDLRDAVRYLPQRGRKKVYIVDEVHMLSKGAFNALLKTLEEPPDHVVFIFATTEPHKIPDTILSRVQRFDFKRIAPGVVVERLRKICDAENIEVADDGLRIVARAGEGSMRDAQSLLDRVISFSGKAVTTEQIIEVLGLVDRNLLYQMLEGILKGDADQCLESIATVYGYGFDLGEFTAELLELLRNATLIDLSPSSERYLDIPSDERTRLEELAKGVPSEVFVRAFQVLVEVHDLVARSDRPRLILEMTVARLVSIRPARPLDQVLERLSTIERRIRQQGGHPPPDGGGRAKRGESPPGASAGGPGSASSFSRTNGGGPGEPQAALAEFVDEEAIVDRNETTPQLGLVELPAEEANSERAAVPEKIEPDEPEAPEPGLSEEDRFAAFQRWLEAGGPRFEVWAHDSALAGIDGARLNVLFPSEFKKRNARDLVDDPRITRGLETFFSGVRSITIGLRSKEEEHTTPSRREIDKDRRKALLASLREQSESDPLVRKLIDSLDAEIIEVVPADEEPSTLERR